MAGYKLDDLCINTIRCLAIDAVEQANSGHPGTPMGAAVMAYVLWDRHLRHNPADPAWPERDRFILSAGHASMLLYALLHLTGYDLPLEEIKRFRQWGSMAPGHPEYGRTPGVEATTGPLGQGFANGVGMAIAENWLAQHYNREGHRLIDHYIYALVSDGDLQEGVASEAASLAGTLRLGKLVYLYDANDVSIEGSTSLAFEENVAQRFEAYGWHVAGPIDGMDKNIVDLAIQQAKEERERPSLIVCRTIIGFGSPNKQGTAAAHGEPLGPEEAVLAKRNLGWLFEEPFYIPPEALAHFREAKERGRAWQEAWTERLVKYEQSYPAEHAQLLEDLSGNLPAGWDRELEGIFKDQEQPIATREASGKVMNRIVESVHSFTGGSADLAPSTKTTLKDHGDYGFDEYCGHNLHFGVREHAMGAICNGMSLHGGIIPYAGTFLIFSDYMRPPIRLAAMMKLRVIFIFTHDSVGLGQDGPTHQPIEQLMGLRTVPNLLVIRPADALESVWAWKIAMERETGPTALILSRQNLPILDHSHDDHGRDSMCGAYVIWESGAEPQVILLATGSEVHIALNAGRLLASNDLNVRVVSVPCWELFDAQPAAYREEILPPSVECRVSLEAGETVGWEHYLGRRGRAIGIDHFGASAPYERLYEEFGLTAARMAEEASSLLKEAGGGADQECV